MPVTSIHHKKRVHKALRQLYQVGYPCPVRKREDPSIFQLRDVVAFTHLMSPILGQGYQLANAICLYPFRDDTAGDFKRGPEYYTFLKRRDMLVMTTRPPLDDEEARNKKHIVPSDCHLERSIFEELREIFALCCRSEVKLSESLLTEWSTATGGCMNSVPASFKFRQTHDARVEKVGPFNRRRKKVFSSDNRYSSIGFFVHLPQIKNFGCPFVASFSMGGNETLAWNYLVGTRFANWLEKPCIVVAEIEFLNVPVCPVTVDYADQLQVSVLLQHDLA